MKIEEIRNVMDDAGFYHKKVRYVDTHGEEHTGWIDAYAIVYLMRHFMKYNPYSASINPLCG